MSFAVLHNVIASVTHCYLLVNEIQQNTLEVLANANLNNFKSGRNRQST
jgi:hypothetical protein